MKNSSRSRNWKGNWWPKGSLGRGCIAIISFCPIFHKEKSSFVQWRSHCHYPVQKWPLLKRFLEDHGCNLRRQPKNVVNFVQCRCRNPSASAPSSTSHKTISPLVTRALTAIPLKWPLLKKVPCPYIPLAFAPALSSPPTPQNTQMSHRTDS